MFFINGLTPTSLSLSGRLGVALSLIPQSPLQNYNIFFAIPNFHLQLERFSARIETILASVFITQLFCERSVMRDPQIRNIFACEISSEFSGTSYDDNESVLHFANRKLFELFVRSLCVKSALVKRLSRLFKRTNSSNSFSCALRIKGII